VIVVRDQVMNRLGDDPDLQAATEAETADFEAARRLLDDEDELFVALPSRDEIDAWQILSDFADTREDPKVRRELRLSVQGAGAFKKFKAAVKTLALEAEWEEFRARAFVTLAEDFLDDEEIEFEDG
jgi:hypothetical protein